MKSSSSLTLFFILIINLLSVSVVLSQNSKFVNLKNGVEGQEQKNAMMNSSAPKLVVGIVVDQMRYDYLTRFKSRFQRNGFNRLMREGFNAKNNHYNYIPTYTAPGHASIYTGTSPMNHGIIGNNWYDKYIKKYIYNAEDELVQPIGTLSDDGKMSPRRLLSTTVTDELELHTQGRAKVIGISLKDRGAILPAGHAADGAYWFTGGDEGHFITSDFYQNTLPEWVQEFNESNVVEDYMKEWNTLYPIGSYTASGPDQNDYERPPRGKDQAVFPYNLKELAESNRNFDLLKSTPYGNSILTDLAILAIDAENMGQNADTDFLAISYSSTDYIGHQYGVNSVEIEDTYLRLDLDIQRLLKNLDDKVGAGNYTVFLTADHGAVNNPAYLQDQGINAGYFEQDEFEAKLESFLETSFGKNDLIENISNNQIFLSKGELARLNLRLSDVEDALANYMIDLDLIDKVYTRHGLMSSSFQNGVGRLTQNGFHHKRSGDVIYHLEPAVIRYSRTGSTHGSPQSYDTHVPLLFFGKGINQGSTFERTEIIDIAPTISSLLGIAFPNAATGNPIPEVLKK
ncbi:alkaline phosphatase [Nonlabens spongiae]|uniref:Alkaline phosphatase n=1 Tax=Nonlabens spongiae TaxID=331648 RepID=A0A1W6MI21_9FLAO|nr:alkaline phosphatase PafA [Nonlabens spongiae]ARN77217.1 alkaline phosphatase [Nonlabens spongiae]